MARNGSSSGKSAKSSKSTRSPVRRTSTPRPRSTAANKAAPAPAARMVTDADVAKRAYELFCSGMPGGQLDHWLQAERELRGA